MSKDDLIQITLITIQYKDAIAEVNNKIQKLQKKFKSRITQADLDKLYREFSEIVDKNYIGLLSKGYDEVVQLIEKYKNI